MSAELARHRVGGHEDALGAVRQRLADPVQSAVIGRHQAISLRDLRRGQQPRGTSRGGDPGAEQGAPGDLSAHAISFRAGRSPFSIAPTYWRKPAMVTMITCPTTNPTSATATAK